MHARQKQVELEIAAIKDNGLSGARLNGQRDTDRPSNSLPYDTVGLGLETRPSHLSAAVDDMSAGLYAGGDMFQTEAGFDEFGGFT